MQGSLQNPVSKTCRGTAAIRAVELLHHPTPIIKDPLAVQFADPELVELIRKRWEDSVTHTTADHSNPPHLYFAARARIVDDRLTQALNQLAGNEQTQAQARSPAEPTATTSSDSWQAPNDLQEQLAGVHIDASTNAAGSRGGCQVVSLGCGLDTRPWRLSFPPGVIWFDVDQEPVMQLKQQLLQENGAQQQQGTLSSAAIAAAAAEGKKHLVDSIKEDKQQQQQQEQQQQEQQPAKQDSGEQSSSSAAAAAAMRYPLQCSRYVAVAADITEPHWVAKLYAAGFKATRPTIWVIEGLMYYLEPEAGNQLLADIAMNSLAGEAHTCKGSACSIAIITHIPRCNLEANAAAPTANVGIARLFKSCVDDLKDSLTRPPGRVWLHHIAASRARCGQGLQSPAVHWGSVEFTEDIFEIMRGAQYTSAAAYPYPLEYSGGVQLPEIEQLVQLELKADT